MKVLGIRFCTVSEQAKELSHFFENGLGLEKREMENSSDDFFGSIFNAGENSWIEMWPKSEEMPECVMLQIVVEDADKMAAFAKAKGLKVSEPTEAYGERIYFTEAPGGLPVTFQSKLG